MSQNEKNARFTVGHFGYGGSQHGAEALREDLWFCRIDLKTCHEYPNADFPYDPNTIHKFIESVDAIILPTRFRLQDCKSVNRLALAWSCKKPVVISPMPSYLQYALEGENCLVATNHGQWIDCITTLRNHPQMASKLAEAGFQTAMSNLHPLGYLDKFLNAIQKTGVGVPWSATTFVQIIIPHYASRTDYLELAVASARGSWGPARDILVVSSSRTDPTDALRKYNVRVHHSIQRLSFSEANNIGLKSLHANTTHILLLNDDAVLSRNALGAYVTTLGDSKQVILNPYSNCDRGWLHNDEIKLSTGKELRPNQTLEEFTERELDEILNRESELGQELIPSPFAAFYATFMDAEVAKRVGFLNTAFLNGGEDADYCYRAEKLLGVQAKWSRSMFVYHFGGKTRKFAEDQNHAKHHEEDRHNNGLLQTKWPKDKKKIGIWCGPGWEKWDLDSYRPGGSGLGGSETCAGRLAETMAADGHYVVLYGDLAKPKQQYGVWLEPWQNFKPAEEYFDLFISSRSLNPVNDDLKAKKVLVWIHDLWVMSGQHISDYHRHRVDKFICLTPFHREFAANHHSLPYDKIEIIPNGVNVEIFH